MVVRGRPFVTAGNWAPAERWPTIHVAYLAPYAYEVFAGVDPAHPWRDLVRSSYDLLRFLYVDRGVAAPPEVVYLDPRTGIILLDRPGGASGPAASGYDSVPIYWRVAVDARWFGRRGEADLRARMLRFPREAWRAEGRLRDRTTTTGRPLSELDGLPLLASVQALAQVADPDLAAELRTRALDPLFDRVLAGEETPYYLHNWLWFGRALELGVVRRYDEPLSFLLLLDWSPFRDRLPLVPFAAGLLLAPLARRRAWARATLLALSLALSLRYLGWRAARTLNFVEPLGPVVSLSLFAAEVYAFSTVALLAVQVGVRRRRRPAPAPLAPGEPHPSVDVLVPIYSESLDILDRTLAACAALRWPRKTIWVCDDSHREEVARLAAEHGASYLRGPRQHAKAGNLNAALAVTTGDLVAVFDTDHVPEERFLERTAPWFRDPRMAVVQTPHHFTNADVFQRAFGGGDAVPNEADLFNHAIQGGRDGWGGAFFVGSGALFRREALASVGGFNLLSITEDIHTSQKLHARGWRSAFVDEDLAAGLSAESFAAYLVQRRRWMLGCLQIFLRDNPLLERGLPLRHRVGYFASLWHFFFPLARVAFFLTPLWFLLFHLHPLFADLPVLLAYLVPHLVLAPLAASALVPGWPRLLWGGVHESAVAFPLARASLDLVLPRRLGFKVTPKGITTSRRRFDTSSSALTLAAAAVAAVALAKGTFELAAFGIEVEAYAFNLFWAGANLVGLLAALLVAWERPQRRTDERIRTRVPIRVGGTAAETVDLSTSGACVRVDPGAPLAAEVEVAFELPEARTLQARLVWRERVGREERAGLAFVGASAEDRRALVRIGFSPRGRPPGRPRSSGDDPARDGRAPPRRARPGVPPAPAAAAPLPAPARPHPRRPGGSGRAGPGRPARHLAGGPRAPRRRLAAGARRRPADRPPRRRPLDARRSRPAHRAGAVAGGARVRRAGRGRRPRCLPCGVARAPARFAAGEHPTMHRAVVAAALLVAALHASEASAGVAESWYLGRARANAKIGNHAAAIEAYRKALAEDPGSREASRGLGLELGANGETDAAVAALDRHLARFPDDWELAFEQARVLQWSRYAYRARDAIRYLRMGLAAHDDPARRRDLARLLGRDRATLEDALREYDRLLAASPGDAALREERLRLLLWDPRHRAEARDELLRRERERPGDERVARDLARLTAEEPRRAAEAADRYAALLARHPADPDLLVGHARALTRAGRRTEARAAWQRAVAARPSPDARVEYANLLASSPATRGAARAEYEAVLREAPRNRRARLGLARVLAAERETSREAIPQYAAVLAEAPHDAEAHRGLARAYAWNGDADRALAHALAADGGRVDGDGLARALRRGREPQAGGGAAAMAQPSGTFSLSGVRGWVAARTDPTPFTSTSAEAGAASYAGEGLRAEGVAASLSAQWRPGPDGRVDGSFGWEGVRPGGAAASGALRLATEGDGRSLSIGVARTPRRDSFRALAGVTVGGRRIGAASDDAVEARAAASGEAGRLEVSARAGQVVGDGFPATFFAAASARIDRPLLRGGAWTLSAGAAAEAVHHARDLSGLDGDPLAPRLFSPPLFAALSPRLSLAREARPARLAVDAGPALQHVSGPGGGLRAGGDVRLSLTQPLGERLRVSADLRAEKIAAVYARLEAGASLSVVF